ncbi:hypothetical protein [Deinococcus sp. NW-56]|uniref:hypothetical protein n=1 Tax=Deinococcus sp. NW-56 TaxID=2080419 RepID=UPI000CF580E4|nr:hypothetical protein [Deinococcus sp. NW-56]
MTVPQASILDPLKRPLSTVVDGHPLDLSSRLGKRRLFRHSVSPQAAGEGWTRLVFVPGWLGRLPSGRACHVIEEVCPTGEVEPTLQRIQEEHGVHLWVRPISLPISRQRGNYWWPEVYITPWVYARPKLRSLLAVAA